MSGRQRRGGSGEWAEIEHALEASIHSQQARGQCGHAYIRTETLWACCLGAGAHGTRIACKADVELPAAELLGVATTGPCGPPLALPFGLKQERGRGVSCVASFLSFRGRSIFDGRRVCTESPMTSGLRRRGRAAAQLRASSPEWGDFWRRACALALGWVGHA